MVKQISLAEVKEHNKASDLWVVIENKVYDLTKFRDEHPGGEEVLVEVAGRDATKDFDEVGHSQDAKDMMKKYCIGELEDKNTEMQLPVRFVSRIYLNIRKFILILYSCIIKRLSKMFGLNHNLCYETKEIGITVGAVIIGVVAVLLVKKIFF
ncbi:hypothetical protein GQX74_007808 [Glossina fuscipes]|nr:hypothetical protein GQX74_007808 [Glossina fuscipes]